MSKFLSIYKSVNEKISQNIVWIILFIILIRIQGNWAIFRMPFIPFKEILSTEYRTQGLNVFATSLLSILTISLAWIAYKASERANNISKLALESERPILNYYSSGGSGEFTIKNVGRSDANDIQIFAKHDGIPCSEIIANINISPDFSQTIQIPVENFNPKAVSILIIYKNSLSDSFYLNGLEWFKSKSGGENLFSLNENSSIKYSNYLKVYKLVNKASLSDLKASISQL